LFSFLVQLHIKLKGKHITGSPFSINVVSSEKQRRGSNDSTTTTTNLMNTTSNNTTPEYHPKSPTTNHRSPSHDNKQQQYNYSKPLSLEITNDYNSYRRQDSNDPQKNIYTSTATTAIATMNNNNNDNDRTTTGHQLHQQYIVQDKNTGTNNTHDMSLESYRNLLLNTAELSAKYVFSIGRRGVGVGDFHGVFGVASDHNNRRIIATDCHNNRIQVFSEEGKFLFMFGQKGNNDGEFQNPTGVGVGPNGEIVVCERLKGRIQVTQNSCVKLITYSIDKFCKQSFKFFIWFISGL